MIPFNIPPYVKESSDYIAQAIANRKICGDGPFTKRCNQQLEEMTGACKALLTTSGTSAMELAALLLDVKPGDEVIVPSFHIRCFCHAGAGPDRRHRPRCSRTGEFRGLFRSISLYHSI